MSQTSIILFSGQGGDRAAPLKQALLDAQASEAGNRFLRACHKVFLTNLATMTEEERRILNLFERDFLHPSALLDDAVRCETEAVPSSTSLILFQSLRYGTAFSQAQEFRCDYAGFSSGMLAACTAATSHTVDEFWSHAVDAFNIAFWIGARAHLHTYKISEEVGDWSLVLSGIERTDLATRLTAFNSLVRRVVYVFETFEC